MKVKGKTQADPSAGPDTAEQEDLELKVRKNWERDLEIPRAGSCAG